MEREKPQTVSEYIAMFPEEVQEILGKIRKKAQKASPEAEEVISYGVPTFKLHGTYFIYFAAYKNHISIYPIPQGTDAFTEQIASYKKGKGTLQFPLNKPIPWPLIDEIIKFSLQTNIERTQNRKPKKTLKA